MVRFFPGRNQLLRQPEQEVPFYLSDGTIQPGYTHNLRRQPAQHLGGIQWRNHRAESSEHGNHTALQYGKQRIAQQFHTLHRTGRERPVLDRDFRGRSGRVHLRPAINQNVRPEGRFLFEHRQPNHPG